RPFGRMGWRTTARWSAGQPHEPLRAGPRSAPLATGRRTGRPKGGLLAPRSRFRFSAPFVTTTPQRGSAVPDALADIRYELAIANRMCAHEGVLDAFGHVSARHPTDPGRYLLSRSRSPELVEDR